MRREKCIVVRVSCAQPTSCHLSKKVAKSAAVEHRAKAKVKVGERLLLTWNSMVDRIGLCGLTERMCKTLGLMSAPLNPCSDLDVGPHLQKSSSRQSVTTVVLFITYAEPYSLTPPVLHALALE